MEKIFGMLLSDFALTACSPDQAREFVTGMTDHHCNTSTYVEAAVLNNTGKVLYLNFCSSDVPVTTQMIPIANLPSTQTVREVVQTSKEDFSASAGESCLSFGRERF